ncbi:hypothetical protein C8A05DRAFT_35607 [Staphylotrichum tortipilum]|uniref:Uncharacterized protein n=1 Tax=Staphylotrichum tortipilum TaxID=2831512 RepID=A0AAN6MIA4_9PEZI|nr:hypothetical protein C8A05DRAFT_35607 [Staphylotrichum longicolle]
MQLVSILSALAATAGIVNAAPAPTTPEPADKPQADEYLWSIIGYANPGCQGLVVWHGTGEGNLQCQNVPALAASFRWGAMTGTAFITSPQQGVCDRTSSLSGDEQGATITQVDGFVGVRRVGCTNGVIQAYKVNFAY